MKKYIIKQDGKIVAYREDDNGALSTTTIEGYIMDCGTEDNPHEDPRWEETNKEVVLYEGHFFFKGEEVKGNLEIHKQERYLENDQKAEVARVSQTLEVTIGNDKLHFITDRSTQSDLQTALMSVNSDIPYSWTDEDGCEFTFTNPDQVMQCLQALMKKANVYPIWTYYKNLIDNAKSIEELQNIVIDYGINLKE